MLQLRSLNVAAVAVVNDAAVAVIMVAEVAVIEYKNSEQSSHSPGGSHQRP